MDMLSLQTSNSPHPVVMVPGDGGCQVYAQIKNTTSQPFPLWVDLRYLIRPSSFEKYFKLGYDNKTHHTIDNEVADITFPGWGETWSVDNLDSRPHDATVYYGDLTRTLTNDTYYKSNYTIRGTPYDFRKAPNENEDFIPKLRNLIEETYVNGGRQSVVLVAHSMGSLYALNFLKLQTKFWKKKYIKAFVAVSAPLGGSMKALKIEASGDNFGIYFESSLWYRNLQRSMPSIAFLLPDPRLWPADEPVIFTPNKNYSTSDYEAFFNDIHFPEGYQMYKDTKAIIDGFEGPTDIDEVYCFHGSNVTTIAGMVYKPPSTFRSGFPDQSPVIVYGNGDGTVNLRSLVVCKRWNNVRYADLPQAPHVEILRDARLINRILDISNSGTSKKKRSYLSLLDFHYG